MGQEEKLPTGCDRLFTATDTEHTGRLLRSAWGQLEKLVWELDPTQGAGANGVCYVEQVDKQSTFVVCGVSGGAASTAAFLHLLRSKGSSWGLRGRAFGV